MSRKINVASSWEGFGDVEYQAFKHCLNQLGLRADQIAFPVIVVPCEMRSTITVKQLISLSPIDRLAFHYQVKADAPDQNGEPIYPSTRFPELTAEFNSRYGPPLRTITSGNGQDDPPLHNPYGGPIPTIVGGPRIAPET